MGIFVGCKKVKWQHSWKHLAPKTVISFRIPLFSVSNHKMAVCDRQEVFRETTLGQAALAAARGNHLESRTSERDYLTR